jgi:hypothetical protein
MSSHGHVMDGSHTSRRGRQSLSTLDPRRYQNLNPKHNLNPKNRPSNDMHGMFMCIHSTHMHASGLRDPGFVGCQTPLTECSYRRPNSPYSSPICRLPSTAHMYGCLGERHTYRVSRLGFLFRAACLGHRTLACLLRV